MRQVCHTATSNFGDLEFLHCSLFSMLDIEHDKASCTGMCYMGHKWVYYMRARDSTNYLFTAPALLQDEVVEQVSEAEHNKIKEYGK